MNSFKRNSIISFIITYLIITLLVIGINILVYLPVNNIVSNSQTIQKTFNAEVKESMSEANLYSNYIDSSREIYQNYFIIFTNMIIALYVVISLGLVVVGLSLRVNSNKNKGIYNAVIAAGITTILYLIYFIISVPGTFNLLFK